MSDHAHLDPDPVKLGDEPGRDPLGSPMRAKLSPDDRDLHGRLSTRLA
jgi:hypothetical protein